MITEIAVPKNLMYVCPELGCNRKYKKKIHLTNHLIHNHNFDQSLINDAIIGEPKEVAEVKAQKLSQNQEELKRKKMERIQRKEDEKRKQQEEEKQMRQLARERLENEIFRQEKEKMEYEKNQLKQQMLEEEEKFKIIRNQRERCLISETSCCICLTNNSTMVIVPCGHKQVCEECSLYLQRDSKPQCPICRKGIEQFVKVYE